MTSNREDRFPVLCLSHDVTDGRFDGVVLVTDDVTSLTGDLTDLKHVIEQRAQLDKDVDKQPVFIEANCLPSKRLIYKATGPVDRDEDDVRRFADAAGDGMKRAIKAGCRCPLLVTVQGKKLFDKAQHVAVLSALSSTYLPIECAEAGKERKIDTLGVWAKAGVFGEEDLKLVQALEKGRLVARDIGGSDPERMAAPRVEEYVRQTLADSRVEIEVISDRERLVKEFPLLAAVDRAASVVERHRARLMFLTYKGKGKITKTFFIVGKGVTYDTGGADVKAGGNMAGMHRDKCGAAAVAGFMKAVSILQPEHIKVVCGLAVVRNSIGEESYVADEIITSRAGVRVRVGNTDAEGRLAMADVLCRMKELAVDAVNPHLFTVATLTGHAKMCVGTAYSIIMDNGPAKRQKMAQGIQSTGEKFGDPFEISTIRREDYKIHEGKTEYEDQLSAPSAKSSADLARGHQAPAAFLIKTAGLDKHCINSSSPLAYSHLDIAGSAGIPPDPVTGAPVVALATHLLM